jgi:hypothetical protein
VGRVVRGASCHSVSCPWGELSMGRVVHGASCPWGELSMGRVVMGRVLMGLVVRGASCLWASGPGTVPEYLNTQTVVDPKMSLTIGFVYEFHLYSLGTRRIDSKSHLAIFLARILWKIRLTSRANILVRVSQVSRVSQEGKNAIYCQVCESLNLRVSRICETYKQAKS